MQNFFEVIESNSKEKYKSFLEYFLLWLQLFCVIESVVQFVQKSLFLIYFPFPFTGDRCYIIKIFYYKRKARLLMFCSA